jgi:hypothetical protein
MSWPYSPQECPRCRYLHALDPPARDDTGFEIPGFCLHPRIGMELFCFENRDPASMEPCPCFAAKPADQDASTAR